MTMRNTLTRIGSGVLLSLLPLSAWAVPFTITFNDVAPGAAVNTTYFTAFGISFTPVNPGPTGGQVFADNPGLPSNPTAALNTLVGINGDINVNFDPARYAGIVVSFAVVPDPDGFGQASVPVRFFNAANTQISTLTINQTIAGNYSTNVAGAVRMVLPGDAYYDNISGNVTVAPEPTTVGLLALGIGTATGAGFLRRRRITR